MTHKIFALVIILLSFNYSIFHIEKDNDIFIIMGSEFIYSILFPVSDSDEEMIVTYFDDDLLCFVTVGYHFYQPNDKEVLKAICNSRNNSIGIEKDYYNSVIRYICIAYDVDFLNNGTVLLTCITNGKISYCIDNWYNIHLNQ